MVLQEFTWLLRNTSKAMHDLQVMVSGRCSLAYLKKNVIKSKKKRNTDMTCSVTIMVLFLYFQRKTTTFHKDFLPFFSQVMWQGRGSNCLFIIPMVLKFLEDKTLISTAPSLSKNPLLQKFKWNSKQNAGETWESLRMSCTHWSLQQSRAFIHSLLQEWG